MLFTRGYEKERPTQKQLDFIEEIHYTLGCESFKGQTKEEASEYINKHIEDFKLENESYVLQLGCASKYY